MEANMVDERMTATQVRNWRPNPRQSARYDKALADFFMPIINREMELVQFFIIDQLCSPWGRFYP